MQNVFMGSTDPNTWEPSGPATESAAEEPSSESVPAHGLQLIMVTHLLYYKHYLYKV